MSGINSSKARKMFLDFFKEKSHFIVDSAPLVLKDDPTLMFTNAGMNQFKDIFLGNKPANHLRIADTQKCLRVSGKHNDLEEVGVDTYHHTMFEMLGNWSFGDYFKKEAIAWAWELLTEVYKIDKSKLYVTVFGGDEEDGLASDEESAEIWSQFIDKDRILRCSKKDNFWEMGNTGPCGPCTEIHVDIRNEEDRLKIDGKNLVNNDHPQVIEIWNNVFIQFNRKADKSLEELPDKHVDTGMGFERLCVVLQDKKSNYDTDIFMPLINKVSQLSGIIYGNSEKTDIAMRVMVDHIRAIAFSICDGQLPSNTGAGYVIRRILRRAVRYYYNFLNINHPALYLLLDELCIQFKDVFPELDAQKDLIKKVIKEEESNFLKTLESGLKKFNQVIEHLGESKIIGGQEAFELYDTFGFPLDLTELMARENNLSVDLLGFEKSMELQKNRSRMAAQSETQDWIELIADGKVEFVGYDQTETVANIIKLRSIKQKNKELIQIVFDKTPFYPEGGGQQGDKGIIIWKGKKINIIDTKKENDLIVHFVESVPEQFKGEVKLEIDIENRRNSMKNHSATHLLQAALKEVLGTHIQQKGSYLNAEILRFDFSHFAKLSDEEIKKIEEIVNQKILSNIPLEERRNCLKSEAIEMGATALFGEKYGDTVRVIIFDPAYSIELCGGTHVKSTGEIGLFKIISETAIAAGIRRIEALTGFGALSYVQNKLDQYNIITDLLKNPKEPIKAISNLLEENAILAKEIEKFETKQAIKLKNDLIPFIESKDGVNYLAKIVDNINQDGIKKISFDIKNEINDVVVILGTVINDKPFLSIIISDSLVKNKGIDANKLIKEISKLIKGGGGGQAFYATAGGNDKNGLQEAIALAKDLIFNK